MFALYVRQYEKTRVTAVNHFQRSIQQGRCVGTSREVHPITILGNSIHLQCKQCLFQAEDLKSLHQHFRTTHFEFVQPDHLARYNSN